MNSFVSWIISSVIFIAVIYGLFVFSSLTFNPMLWDPVGRFLFVIFSISASVGIATQMEIPRD